MRSAVPPFVLVVDDDAAIRDLFVSVLRRAGAEVGQASGGAEALRQIRVKVPDAVVCDLEMPHLDGLAFCRSVRGDAHTRALPILIVSGAGRPAFRLALDAGCTAVLAKPCSGVVLVAAVDRLLDGSSTAWPDGLRVIPPCRSSAEPAALLT